MALKLPWNNMLCNYDWNCKYLMNILWIEGAFVIIKANCNTKNECYGISVLLLFDTVHIGPVSTPLHTFYKFGQIKHIIISSQCSIFFFWMCVSQTQN